MKGKSAKFEWDPEKQRALVHVQAALQVTLHLESYNLVLDMPLLKAETITIIQVRLGSSLDQDGRSQRGEKWLNIF